MQGRRLAGSMAYLRALTAAVLEECRLLPGQQVPGGSRNSTGGTLIRPGGREAYAAFWIRDFALSLDSGLIRPSELEHAILLVATRQAASDTETASGSLIPAGSIPDHVTPDGRPIFFPGTDDPTVQGQPYGYFPPLDNAFFLVEMVWRFLANGGRPDILARRVYAMTLLERLDRGFASVPADDESGLVHCTEDRRGASFGFTDIVVHSGSLLFASLLRRRAALRLAAVHHRWGDARVAPRYRSITERISDSLCPAFDHPSGLLRASTGRSAQPDVWGSAFAVASGALPSSPSARVAEALVRALRNGTIAWKGNIRHIPLDHDFSDRTAWERTVGGWPLHEYQNGAYWGTPTGWVCAAVASHDEEAAVDLAEAYIDDLRAGDFREGGGAPFECVHPRGEYCRNAVYLTTVSVPLAEFERLGWAGGPQHEGSAPWAFITRPA